MKNKKTSRTEKPTPEYDSTRQQNVLLEGMSFDIKTLAEGHGSIVKKLEEHDVRFDRIESELSSVKVAVLDNSMQIKDLKTGLGKVEQRLDTVEQRLDTVEQKLDTVEQKLDTVEQKLDTVEQKLDTVAADYGHRITTLESKSRAI
ncbi:MAG: hypothetical protein V2A72_00365 [Candidatus Omnitrophota bacterium]